LPPAVQDPAGLKIDSDFAPPEHGFLQTLLGRGSDGKIYELDAADHRKLRPIILRSERAVRNEQIAAEARQRRARGGDHLPITIIGDGEFEPALPPAKILPPVPRPVPEPIEWDGDIIMPPTGAGDGGHDK
jgi:hypothetical protein